MKEDYFNDSIVNLAKDKIDRAIFLYPTRLDLWFGKSYALGQLEDYQKQKELILECILKGEEIQWNWLWSDGKVLEDPKEFFKSSVQDYIMQWYDAQEDEVILSVATEMIRVFPNDPVSYTNLGIAQLFLDEVENALESLMIANKLDPQDIIVLFNMAYVQEVLEKWDDARVSYEKIIGFGDKEEKTMAKEKIDLLPK